MSEAEHGQMEMCRDRGRTEQCGAVEGGVVGEKRGDGGGGDEGERLLRPDYLAVYAKG